MDSSPTPLALLCLMESFLSVSHNNRIQVFECSSGRYVRKFGSYGNADGCLSYPWGVCVHRDLVFVSEETGHRVSVFSRDGQFIRKWGSQGSSSGQFSNPRGICVSSDGYVFIADHNNHRIQVFANLIK